MYLGQGGGCKGWEQFQVEFVAMISSAVLTFDTSSAKYYKLEPEELKVETYSNSGASSKQETLSYQATLENTVQLWQSAGYEVMGDGEATYPVPRIQNG